MDSLLSIIKGNKVYAVIILVICISISGIFIATTVEPKIGEDIVDFFQHIFSGSGILGNIPQSEKSTTGESTSSEQLSSSPSTNVLEVQSAQAVPLPVSAVPEPSTFLFSGLMVIIVGIIAIFRQRM